MQINVWFDRMQWLHINKIRDFLWLRPPNQIFLSFWDSLCIKNNNNNSRKSVERMGIVQYIKHIVETCHNEQYTVHTNTSRPLNAKNWYFVGKSDFLRRRKFIFMIYIFDKSCRTFHIVQGKISQVGTDFQAVQIEIVAIFTIIHGEIRKSFALLSVKRFSWHEI